MNIILNRSNTRRIAGQAIGGLAQVLLQSLMTIIFDNRRPRLYREAGLNENNSR